MADQLHAMPAVACPQVAELHWPQNIDRAETSTSAF